jgi:hypothetical protein
MEKLFISVCNWIETNNERDAQRVVLHNLLSSFAQYLRVSAANLDTHISVLALATRSLYELNVRTRAILTSPDQLDDLQSEAITDKIQTYGGILALPTLNGMSEERVSLRNEIDRLNALCVKYGLRTIQRPLDTGALSPEVGLENEHRGLFKLFSKLVHPSSYLTNDYRNAALDNVRLVLQLILKFTHGILLPEFVMHSLGNPPVKRARLEVEFST